MFHSPWCAYWLTPHDLSSDIILSLNGLPAELLRGLLEVSLPPGSHSLTTKFFILLLI